MQSRWIGAMARIHIQGDKELRECRIGISDTAVRGIKAGLEGSREGREFSNIHWQIRPCLRPSKTWGTTIYARGRSTSWRVLDHRFKVSITWNPVLYILHLLIWMPLLRIVPLVELVESSSLKVYVDQTFEYWPGPNNENSMILWPLDNLPCWQAEVQLLARSVGVLCLSKARMKPES